jgi:DNA topoisomerase 6 subunit A-like protein
MHNQSVNELRFLFLEQIATRTPKAAARLFELRDSSKWQAEYYLSADWLESFLQTALEQEQEHMDSIAKQVDSRTALVTKKWTKLKRQADKNNKLNARQLEEYQESKKAHKLNVKEAAYQVMRQAYMRASANGTLPANARQVMYAARPLIIELTGKTKPWSSSSYFTQHLLPDYVRDNPEEAAEWDVVFDARGHFSEPHTETEIGLGTLQVRGYVREWEPGKRRDVEEDLEKVFKTSGSTNRYGAVLFIEKEGFNELWRAVKISERYDLAIMSTKGMSTTASRTLIEELSALELPIYVLRDFDKPGFSIAHTLCNDTRRYQFSKKPNVIDLGLRLEDVEALGLESEPVVYDGDADPRDNLRESGATDAELKYLVRGRMQGGWYGERVEINAVDSRRLVTWLEAKLKAAGVSKIVPDDDVLTDAYREALLRRALLEKAKELAEKTDINDATLPVGASDTISLILAEDPTKSWDAVVWGLAQVAKH